MYFDLENFYKNIDHYEDNLEFDTEKDIPNEKKKNTGYIDISSHSHIENLFTEKKSSPIIEKKKKNKKKFKKGNTINIFENDSDSEEKSENESENEKKTKIKIKKLKEKINGIIN